MARQGLSFQGFVEPHAPNDGRRSLKFPEFPHRSQRARDVQVPL